MGVAGPRRLDSLPMSEPQPPSHPDEATHPSSGTSVLEREELQEQEPGDSERFSHYVKKDKVMSSAMSGQPVVALCGKVWTPGRDPKKFPLCPRCKEIYEGLQSSGDGSEGGKRGPLGFGRGRRSSGSGE